MGTKFYPILIPSPLDWTNMDILHPLSRDPPVDFLLTLFLAQVVIECPRTEVVEAEGNFGPSVAFVFTYSKLSIISPGRSSLLEFEKKIVLVV